MNTTIVVHSNPDVTPNLRPQYITGGELSRQLFEQRRFSERYLEDSILYYFTDGFTAEVIQKPGNRFMRAGIFQKVMQELKPVVLRSLDKTEEQADVYASQAAMAKNLMWVDWLIVARKHGQVIGLNSATYITPSLIYLNWAMVVPEEQSSCIGGALHPLLWKLAVEEARSRNSPEPDIVCRTRNRNAASALLHFFKDSKISTEVVNDERLFSVCKQTTNYIGCSIDEKTGISNNVYPEGLPSGSKSKNERINQTFDAMGPRDAVYVLGRFNDVYAKRLLSRVRKVEEKVFAPAVASAMNYVPLLMSA